MAACLGGESRSRLQWLLAHGRALSKRLVQFVDALRQAADRAAEHGVTLGLQNHHDIGIAVEAYEELLDEVNHPQLKAMFDPWSVALTGGDLRTSAERLAPRMVQTTLAD